MDVEKTIQFILEQQSKSEARLGAIEDSIAGLIAVVGKVLDAVVVLKDTVEKLAQQQREMAQQQKDLAQQQREMAQQQRELAQQQREQGKALDQRIDRLVSAIGVMNERIFRLEDQPNR